jgi:DNA polymerase-3 subunit epsilon
MRFPGIGASETARPAAAARRGYAVVDLETTGLHPDYHHRVVAMAIVLLDGDGRREAEWTTLLNPERDVGPTHIHGIRASDVADAPRFAEVAGDVIRHIAGRVLVAHNLRFDVAFLASELRRADADLGVTDGICTLGLASRFGIIGQRSLPACCAAFGIPLDDHHSAHADAVATAMLLRAYMKLVDRLDRVVDPAPVRDAPWPDFPPAISCRPRGAAVPRTTLAHFVAGLPPGPELNVVDQEAAVEYLALLDRVLEDRTITDEEIATLSTQAVEWGLDQKDVHEMHWSYVEGVRRAAWADGRLTDDERNDLMRVAQLLSLDPAVAAAATSGLSPYEARREQLADTTVCFTGASVCTMNGNPLTRADQLRLAEQAGATVVDTLTKKVDLLVLADAASMSGKARKTAAYGVRRMAEPVFWRMAGVDVD